MFTGIVSAMASVHSIHSDSQSSLLVLDMALSEPAIGESIAINGVCLTLTAYEGSCFHFDISPETLSRTTLGSLKSGDRVNIERAMQSSDRFGGHYVSGHVDRTSKIQCIENKNEYTLIKIIDFSPEELLLLPEKGSICIDGVSLTINHFTGNGIELMLIPHTLQVTTLSKLKANDQVNIEFDYIARLITHQQSLLNNTMKEEAL